MFQQLGCGCNCVTVDYTDKQVGSFIVYEVPAAELHQTTMKIE